MNKTAAVTCVLVLSALPAFGQAKELSAEAARIADEFESLYKQLHAQPELSNQEEKTAKFLAEELQKIGFEVTQKVGGHGVVGVLKNGAGPTLLVRTDMDALPVDRADRARPTPARSKRPTTNGSEVGVMHACGHDMHMTALVGTARLLAGIEGPLAGHARVHRPAGRGDRQRRAGDARRTACSRASRKPDFCLALHVRAGLARRRRSATRRATPWRTSTRSTSRSTARAATARAPHTTIDPIVLAARIVLDLQTIVSREIEPDRTRRS